MGTSISTEREAHAAWSTVADPADAGQRDLVDQVGVVEAVAEIIRTKKALHGYYPLPTMKDLQTKYPDTRLLIPGDDEWPEAATHMATPPLALWVTGPADIGAALAPSLAVTGARASTSYGQFVADGLGGDITEAGITVLTGGAFGIDAAATRGALAVGGAPIVLQAGGVARAYPAAHTELFRAVINRGGAVISEVAPDVAPTRARFVRRNTLLGWLSTAVVIVEAGIRSGSLQTARSAIEASHPVGAVPGPITSTVSAGTHDLLARNAARIITTGQQAAALIT